LAHGVLVGAKEESASRIPNYVFGAATHGQSVPKALKNGAGAKSGGAEDQSGRKDLWR